MEAEARARESLECETSSSDFERESAEDNGAISGTIGGEVGTKGRIITRRDKVRGFSCVCVAAFIWVVSSYWVKDLEKNGMTPLLVTSLANSMFTVLLPFAYLQDSPYMKSCQSWFSKRLGHKEEGEALITRNSERSEKASSASVGEESDSKQEKKAVNRKRVFKLSLCMWPIWFLCLYIYNWSFLLTTVMSNTILSIGGTSFFTYMLELRLMKSAFSKTKLASISLCIIGTILWTYGNYRGDSEEETEKNSQKNALLGNFLCLISAGLYAVTSIIVGKYLPEKEGEEEKAEMSLFWGYTGLINLCVTMPVNIILSLAGKTDIANLPARMFGMVMLKGLMDNLLSNYLWAYAVLFIGPTSANVGMSIETPMVVIIDLVTRNASYLSNARSTALNVTGALVILMGFFGLSM